MTNQTDNKQYHIQKLQGYRAATSGIPRERNWFTPVRPGSLDERAWFDGYDLFLKDMKR